MRLALLAGSSPLFVATTLLTLGSLPAQFGGDGRDGAFRPTADVTLDTTTRPDGWSFTSIDVPSGVIVTLTGAHPAILRSQGSIGVDGWIRADGNAGGRAGPGGFAGGVSGGQFGDPGAGPHPGLGGIVHPWIGTVWAGSGGHRTSGVRSSGAPYGTEWPFDLRGGSGGGATARWLSTLRVLYEPGAGGGGTVVLLADGDVRVDGAITALGGNGGPLGDGAGGGGSIFVRTARDATIHGLLDARGGTGLLGGGFRGGDGIIRIDAYGTPPTVAPFAVVEPTARLAFLPALDTSQPTRGQVWSLEARSVPGDDVLFGFSSGSVSIPIPGLGLLGLDPNGGFIALAIVRVGATGIEPTANYDLLLPPDPGLAGRPAVTQALTLRTSSPEGPRLSNTIVQTIR